MTMLPIYFVLLPVLAVVAVVAGTYLKRISDV